MRTLLKISVIATGLVGMLIADAPLLPMQLVPDAHAILGVRRRTAVVVGTEVHAADEAQMAQAQQQTAVAQQQAAAAQQQAAAAKQQAAAAPPAPPAAAAGSPLPLGTVVAALPAGCASTPVGGVEYYYCGGNFYRAVFQGNFLVYVTAQPK
jgi:biotin carboxyl carrier protein